FFQGIGLSACAIFRNSSLHKRSFPNLSLAHYPGQGPTGHQPSPPFRIPSPALLINIREIQGDPTVHPSGHGPHMERRESLPYLARGGSRSHRDSSRSRHGGEG